MIRTTLLRALAALAAGTGLLAASGLSGSQPDPLSPPANGPRKADPTWHALRNATVHVQPGQVLEHATLVLRDGKIVSVHGTPKAADEPAKVAPTAGEKKPDSAAKPPKDDISKSPEAPPGARTWDCTGLHIYPGFIDPYVEIEVPAPAPDSPGLHWNPRVTPQRAAVDVRGVDAALAESLRKLGYTAAAVSPSGGIFRGSSAVVSLATPEPDRSMPRPPVYAENVYQTVAMETGGFRRGGGAPGEATDTGAWAGYPNSQMGAIALIRQTFADADWQAAARATGALTDPPNCLDHLAPPTTSGDDAKAPKYVFNADDELEVFRVLKIAREFNRPAIVLGSGMEFRRLDGVIDECRADPATPLVIPLNFPDAPRVATLGQMDNVSLRELMTWEQAPTNPRRLEQAGLNVSLTTSKLRGDRSKFRDNLRKAIAHGLTEDQALAMITTRPAALLGVADRMGTVEHGKLANLVIADGDIFASKTKLRDVWVDGKRHEITAAPSNLKGEWEVVNEPGPKAPEGGTLRITWSIDKDNNLTVRKHVTEPGAEPKVTKAAAKNVRVESSGYGVSAAPNRLSFSFDHEPFGSPGVFTVAGVVEGDTMMGDGVRADGNRFRWTATRIAEEPAVDPEPAAGARGVRDAGFAGTWNLIEDDGKPVDQADIDDGVVPTMIIDRDNSLTVKLRDREIKAATTKIEGDTITVTIDGAPFGWEGMVTSTGKRDADTITGEATLADGTKRTWTLKRVAAPRGEGRRGERRPDSDKPADAVTGAWSGTTSSPQMPQDMSFTMNLKLGEENTVTGSVTSHFGTVDIQDGKFTKAGENAGTLTFTITPPDTDKITLTLEVGADSFTGTGTGNQMNFNLTASRTSPAAAAADDDEEAPKDIPEHYGYPFGPYAVPVAPSQDTVLFTNATIWTSSDRGVIPNGWMLIQGGKIKALGEGMPGSFDSGSNKLLIYDLGGKHITPGLIDCHSHTGISRGVNESGQAVTAEVRIQDVTNPDALSWYYQLAGGITAVNNLHGSANPIGGQNAVNKNRWGARKPDDLHFEGAIPGIKFALGENVKRSNGSQGNDRYPNTRMGVETLIRDRFTAAREYLEATKRRSDGATKGEEKHVEHGSNLQGSHRVATRDGTGAPNLQGHREHAERGEVRLDDADASSGSVGAVEHRGGPRQAESHGLSAIPQDRSGLAGGVDHAIRTRGEPDDVAAPSGDSGTDAGDGSSATGINPSARAEGFEIAAPSHSSPSSLRRSVAPSLPLRRDLELECLAEILAGERLVHCHSYRQDEILMLCRVARDFGFKIGTFQHILEGYKVADEIRENAIGASAFSDWWGYKVEVQDAIPFGGAIMHDAGVVVSFNSDSDELARRMNVEAGKAVKYGGLDPAEALKFVTLNPARQLRIEDRVGSLEVGKDADFAIWSVPHMGGPALRAGSNVANIPGQTSPNGKHPANAAPVTADADPARRAGPPSVDGTPLSTMARCEQTWIDGRCYFSTERDAELRVTNAKERARIIQKLLAAGNRSAGRGDAAGSRPDGAGGPARGRRGPRPTDDALTSGAFDAPFDDEAPTGLLHSMLSRAADQRREHHLQLWRRGIDPDFARCGDCGESLGAMGGAR